MKRIYVLLIIVFILFGILWMKINNSNKQPEYSLRDIKEILDKAEDIKNYECELPDGGIYKRKNNVMCVIEEEYKHIINYDSNKHFIISESSKIYLENKPATEHLITSNSYIGIGGNNILSVDWLELFRVEEERYKNEECLKVIFKLNYEPPEKEFTFYNQEIKGTITIWINVDNGLIMKIKAKDNEENEKEAEYTYKFNTVTDADVTPDLTGYTKIETSN